MEEAVFRSGEPPGMVEIEDMVRFHRLFGNGMIGAGQVNMVLGKQ